MTEELKKEAKGYVKTIAFVYETEVVRKIVCMYAEEAYLASAEPREKRIAELEATNKRISNECHTLVDTLEKKQEIINNTKAIDESFARLQEENAELREVIDNDVDKKIYVQLANKAKLADVQKVQLAKAKDFILKLTTYLEGHTNYDFEYELIKEVKQFLKDSEVEK